MKVSDKVTEKYQIKRWKIQPSKIVQVIEESDKDLLIARDIADQFHVTNLTAEKYLQALAEAGEITKYTRETKKQTFRFYRKNEKSNSELEK